MKKFLIIIAIIAIALFAAFKYMQYNTKKASPETTVNYKTKGLDITLKYSSPSKKGREIFGALIPYGQVWRTGANEATIFESKTDLAINGQTLPAGKYTLWTVPNTDNWQVIFDKNTYSWGVSFKGKVSYDSTGTALTVAAPTTMLPTVQENFKIEISDDSLVNLNLSWDKTKVSLPIAKK